MRKSIRELETRAIVCVCGEKYENEFSLCGISEDGEHTWGDNPADEVSGEDYSLVVESATALQHGSGRDPFRWVSGLTPSEREALRNATSTVFFVSAEYSGHYSQSGFKVVKREDQFGYGFREPTSLEMDIILSLTTNPKRHEWSTNSWKCIRCGESAKNIRMNTRVRESRVNTIYWRDWQRSAKPCE